MRKFLFLGSVTLIIVVAAAVYFVKNYELEINHPLIKVGSKLPVNVDELKKISKYKFYILLVDKEQAFPRKYSWPLEEVINIKIGGLIERADSGSFVFTEIFGPNNDKNKIIFSVVIITDKNGIVVGVYPNKQLYELVGILQLHPDLIDLNLAGTAL